MERMMIFRIGEIHANTPHLFSDLIELYLLLNSNSFRFLSDSDMESIINSGVISPEEQGFSDDKSEESSAEINEKLDKKIEDVFRILEYRQGSFGHFYPFNVDRRKIILNNNSFISLSPYHKLYIFLLACSRLRSFKGNRSLNAEKDLIQLWAKYFTMLGKLAFKSLLPNWANTYIFDANLNDRKDIFGTDLRDALKRLGRMDMIAPYNVHEDNINRSDSSGDSGLDLVGIGNFNDNAISNIVIFGQCASQEINWHKKTFEGNQKQLQNYFNMQPLYTNYVLIPLSYRDSNGGFADPNNLGGVLLLDRKRILDLTEKTCDINVIVNSEWMKDFTNDFNNIVTNCNF